MPQVNDFSWSFLSLHFFLFFMVFLSFFQFFHSLSPLFTLAKTKIYLLKVLS